MRQAAIRSGRAVAFSAAALLSLTLGACGVAPTRDGPPPAPSAGGGAGPIPGPEPRSRYGNPASYEEMGRRYVVMDSAAGYVERGIASWYGTKFHGRRTSSGEPYDMHAMTAAHKTLPLPTWVEVTNLRTRDRILVRVNDRGPFVENRIIDLSYEAARRLGMVTDGTGLVEVRALTFGEPLPADSRVASRPPPPAPVEAAAAPAAAPPAGDAAAAGPTEPRAAPAIEQEREPRMYAQVGAFSEPDNAAGLRDRLRQRGFLDAAVHPGGDAVRPFFRVRIGPMVEVEQYDRLIVRLSEHGLTDVNLVIE